MQVMFDNFVNSPKRTIAREHLAWMVRFRAESRAHELLIESIRARGRVVVK